MPWITIVILTIAILAAIAAYHFPMSIRELDELFNGDE